MVTTTDLNTAIRDGLLAFLELCWWARFMGLRWVVSGRCFAYMRENGFDGMLRRGILAIILLGCVSVLSCLTGRSINAILRALHERAVVEGLV